MLRKALKLEGTEVLKVFIDKYPSKKHDFSLSRVLDVWWDTQRMSELILEGFESMDIVSEFPEALLLRTESVSLMLRLKRIWSRLWLKEMKLF